VFYYGNDIAGGSDFNQVRDTNTPPVFDRVNNVENVFLPPPLSANYSITVIGRLVNVNAVADNPLNIAQDYALVVSCGDGEWTNAIHVAKAGEPVGVNAPELTTLTNNYVGSTNYFGQTIQNQRVGAQPPPLSTNVYTLPDYANAQVGIGVANQWHFYVIENTTTYTNARFLISNPRNLSIPRMGVNVLVETNATRLEADVDMYVSQDPGLLDLVPSALTNSLAYRMLGREGTSALVLTNAKSGFYYIAVKSEDQMAAEYSLQVLFSPLPFSQNNDQGSLLTWYDPVQIPDGTPVKPGITNILLGPGDPTMLVRRVIVSNLLTHELVGDLIGTLNYPDGTFAVLNNHSRDGMVSNYWYVYDDSEEGDIPGAQRTDGPGSLHDFAGRRLGQIFTFFMEDNAQTHVGYDRGLFVFLEKQPPLTEGITVTIQPGRCREDFIEVPAMVDSMTIDATIVSGSGPVSLTVCEAGPGGICSSNYDVGAGVSVTIDEFSIPRIAPRTYVTRLCNNGPKAVTVFLIARLHYAVTPLQTVSYTVNPKTNITDNAVTYSSITITNHSIISSLNVGMLLTNSQASDLAITLISPSGKRILLFENRGGNSARGVGTSGALINGSGILGFGYTNMTSVYTNNFDEVLTGPYAAGATFGGWTVLSNYVVVYPELAAPWLNNNLLVLNEGTVSNSFPVTNSSFYNLSFKVNHAPYLVGTVGWWPFDRSSADIFSGLDGQLLGNVAFTPAGEVNEAYFGDGVATRMVVPQSPQLDVGRQRGFTVEGWIYPTNVLGGTNGPISARLMFDGFEGATPGFALKAGTNINGWLVERDDVDVISHLSVTNVPVAHRGTNYIDLNAGAISTNLNTIPGKDYLLSFAYTKNPDNADSNFVAGIRVSWTGQPDWNVSYTNVNSVTNPAWLHTTH
ncbi:MAG TPA: hypothetical protein VEC99_00755, partial [Clostridia bacterium]|nr:hypothetical protein [Clostridia bacterium]